MFTSVHNLNPLPLDQNPKFQSLLLRNFYNLVALGFQHLLNFSNTSNSLTFLMKNLTDIHLDLH